MAGNEKQKASNLLPLDMYCVTMEGKCDNITDDFVKKHVSSKPKSESTSNLLPLDMYQDEQPEQGIKRKEICKTDDIDDDGIKKTRKYYFEEDATVVARLKNKRYKDEIKKIYKNAINKDEKTNKGAINEEEDGEIEEGEISAKKEAIKQQIKDGQEAEARELEEGELPEDIEEPVAGASGVFTMSSSRPIDYAEEFSRKKKVALLLAYCGAGFHGMQKNPEVETIELKLIDALCAIKAIRLEHKTEFLTQNNNQLSFQRAARTDKGVSAARQVVSLKLVANETFVADVNKHLPKEIRVFALERVTKKFDAKCSCSGRSYEYLLPSFAFAPSKGIMDPSYRLSEAQLSKVNTILSQYVGTHNFHNFTSGKRFSDKSAYRYITSFEAGQPFECRGHEFLPVEVSGQSFMIHQIRKMMGLCIAICRGYCDMETVGKSWNEPKLDIPKAPGLGLLLSRVHFHQYDRKYCADGMHNPLTWEKAELEVERFKIEKIWHSIIEEEIKKSSLVTWLKTLNNHTYTDSGMNQPMSNDYRGRKGIFPPNQQNPSSRYGPR